jgi:HSP20 family protein
LDPFRSLKSQIDNLFEDWTGGLSRAFGGTVAPRVDVSETDKEITVVAELPGVDEKDIEVTLVGNQLTIKGQKKNEAEEKTEKEGRIYHRVERSYGAFQRTMTLPYDLDPDQVSADFRDGLLTVRLPKPADQQKAPKRIEVRRTV